MCEVENRITNIEDGVAEDIQSEQQQEKRIQKNENILNGLWDNIKCTNIRIIGVPEREEREQGIENLFQEIMTENLPNPVKEIDIQAQEVLRAPNKMNSEKPTARHIIIKMLKVKDKERALKASREKHLVTYKGVSIRP